MCDNMNPNYNSTPENKAPAPPREPPPDTLRDKLARFPRSLVMEGGESITRAELLALFELARGRPEGPSAPPQEARRLLVELLEGYDDYVAQTVGGAALIKRIRAYLAVDLGSRPPEGT